MYDWELCLGCHVVVFPGRPGSQLPWLLREFEADYELEPSPEPQAHAGNSLASVAIARYKSTMDETGDRLCDPHELIELVRAGDIEALDHITRRYGRRLEALGQRVCRNSADADDALQDALLMAGTKLSSYRGEGSIEAWLSRMVVNACHRMRRGRKNDPRLHDHEAEVQTELDDPEVAAGRGELMVILGELVAELPARDRLIFLLAEAEEWTGPQIAAKLEMSADAVRARLSRVRRRLRVQVEERLEEA